MPIGLKNTVANYKIIMNTIPENYMGKIIIVYIIDVVVKSKRH